MGRFHSFLLSKGRVREFDSHMYLTDSLPILLRGKRSLFSPKSSIRSRDQYMNKFLVYSSSEGVGRKRRPPFSIPVSSHCFTVSSSLKSVDSNTKRSVRICQSGTLFWWRRSFTVLWRNNKCKDLRFRRLKSVTSGEVTEEIMSIKDL